MQKMAENDNQPDDANASASPEFPFQENISEDESQDADRDGRQDVGNTEYVDEPQQHTGNVDIQGNAGVETGEFAYNEAAANNQLADNPERPNANAPLVNIDIDETNPFLLAPDHYLLVPLYKKLKTYLDSYNEKAGESLRQLSKLEQYLALRYEDAGVMLHTFYYQLATAQDYIEAYEQQYAELQAAREAVQYQQEQLSTYLSAAEADYSALYKAEESIRDQNQRVANEVIAQQSQNSELRSEAIVRKRAVYRGEEQLKELEALKVYQEETIQTCQNRLKQLYNDETYVLKQIDLQQYETNQAQYILDEAAKYIMQIQTDITNLSQHWKMTLQAIEKRSTYLNNDLAPVLSNLDSEKLSMQHSVVSARKEIESQIQQLSQVSQQIREKQSLEMALKDRAEQLQNVEIAQLLQQLQALKASNDAANARLANITKDIQYINKEADAVSKETDNQNKAISSAENYILINNAAFAAENRQFAAYQSEMARLKQAIANTEREIAHTENEAAKRNLDIVQCAYEIDSLENAQESLKSELAEKDRLITSYEYYIKKNANSIEYRSSAITRLNKKLEEYQKAHPESDNGPLYAMLNNIGKELATAARAMKDTQAVWLRAYTDLVMLNEELRREDDEIKEKEEQRDLLDRKLNDLEYEKQSNLLKISAVNRDIEFLHNDIQKMNLQIASCYQQIKQQNEHNFDSETATLESVDTLADKLQKSTSNLEQLKNTKIDCAEQLCEVEQQIMLWTRKIYIQYRLMQTIMDQCNYNSGGEISVLENEVHYLQNEINFKIKQQKQLINQLERGIDIRETMSATSYTRMKLDSLGKTTQASGATVARELEVIKKRIDAKREELDRARDELQYLIARKQQLLASNAELAGMVEQMRGEAEGEFAGGAAEAM